MVSPAKTDWRAGSVSDRSECQAPSPVAYAPGSPDARPAFTLIELLVVIAIIAILMALTAAGTFQVIDGQRSSNTELTMHKVHKALQEHYRAVIDQADDDFKGGTGLAATAKSAAMNLAGNDPKRAKVIMRKIYLKREFPTSYGQANNDMVIGGVTIPKKKVYSDALVGANANNGAESSTCLLLALQQNRGGVQAVNETTFAGALVDTNGDKLPEIVDGWSAPIYFSLFPTGDAGTDSSNPNRAGIGARLGDLADPEGLLLTPAWFGSASRTAFENAFHKISPDGGKRSFFLIPSVAAAGKNRQMGLTGPFMTIQNADDASDNLFSHRLRLGQGQ